MEHETLALDEELRRDARIPAVWMRGGTSKCWILRDDHLPIDLAARDALLLRLFGSPDQRQIDGVGGGTSTTSKAMIVDAAGAFDGVVEYELAQVSVATQRVEWDSNCGNCASAVALYAVQEGLVPLTAPATTLTLINRHSGLVLEAVVQTPDAQVPPHDGDEIVPGTVYPGVRVVLRWSPPTWSEYGRTLPTGSPVDVLIVDGKRVLSTMIDAGSPTALVSVDEIGFEGGLSSRPAVAELLPWLMRFRQAAAARMGLPGGGQAVPKVGIVGPAASESGADIEARMVSMTELHPAIGITSAVAVAAAAGIEGSAVHSLLRASAQVPACEFSIGTFAGSVRLGVERGTDGSAQAVDSVRSARRLADATLFVGRDWVDIVSEDGMDVRSRA
ncbi:PrpF domain-containing protein [Microbacterium sp. USTB-Y]|uniref:PrpF domain-containing protein n=1 Tax=Microbacterium sp. USTB-Y TaxID=2823692 RepID=UPI00203D4BDF|nr:PrpF domain-containing protein [Microbacterium sp. USTB-Y]